ncbi:MAG: ATP-binding protein [Verrucomicrobiota bacterium]|nr:ATP-binding protein [Verrucomicrobiota bacterium]
MEATERFPRELEILRQLADALPQIVWITRPDGRHLYYNRRWYEYTGLPIDQGIDEHWDGLFHPDDLERTNLHWAEALQSGEPYNIEFRFRRADDGVYRWFLGRAVPHRDVKGHITNWFGTCTDIHEQKLVELALREARDEMRDENIRKDQFLATISHELRTPLNAIVGWTRLMQEDLLSPDERKEAVHSIMRNAEAQAHLIEDVLDISRIINQKLHLERETRALSEIVLDAVNAIRPSADAKEIALTVSTAAAGLLVRADARRLQQVVLNLLSNAVKFTPKNGRISVSIAPRDSKAAVEITDTGKGISPELLPHIFERFRQGDSSSTRQHGGLGLGLAIAQQLVAMHHGSIEAESPGENLGSRFTVLLPIVTLENNGSPPEMHFVSDKDPVATQALRGAHILVVDDEKTVRDLLKLALTKCGATVVAAASVAEALASMEQRRPDVIITDIAMPGVDGYEFIRTIRTLTAPDRERIPVIALTAFASAQDRKRALELGFDQHLAKPVDPLHLIETIVQVRGIA